VIALPDDIDDCQTDAERARWLLRAAPAHLIREENFVRMVLRSTGFQAGVAYLDVELSHLRDIRRDDGESLNLLAIKVARGRMDRIACGLPPRHLGA
jgi:hypothetical protein